MIRRRVVPLLVFLTLAALCCSHRPPAGNDGDLAKRIGEAVAATIGQGAFSGSVLVTHGRDGVLFSQGYGLADRSLQRANRTDTCYDIASLGKMFTAVAIAQLAEQNRLRFDVAVGPYLPQTLAGSEIGRKVTIAQILTHTSGIPDLPDALFNAPPETLQGYIPYFSAAKLEFEPGAQRAYSNAGFVLLGMIVESLSGQRYEDYVQRNVFQRAGMQRAGFQRSDCSGETAIGYTRSSAGEWQANSATVAPKGGPHGGAFVAATELVKFFHALRTGKLVGPEMGRVVTTPQPGSASAYGFGVLDFATDRLVGHSGGNEGVSADAYTYWQSGYTIVVLSNLGPPASHDVARAIRRVIEPQFEAKK
ncbi:MAG TPA: serine hydrolase [Thermoanaerobaculia bacterium]|jgi:CubicO group peptidase (beta-lactamase class C family)